MIIAIIGVKGILKRYGGAEASVYETANRLAKKGHKVIVYCRRHLCCDIIIDKNIELVFLPTINDKNFGTIVHVFMSTLHVLFSKADIVHYHSLGPSLFSSIPRFFGKKTIVTVHALDWRRRKWGYFAGRFLYFCEYCAIFFPNKTIVVSRALKIYFETKFNKEVYYIPNGVDVNYGNKDAGVKQTAKYVLFVGRLVPEKGLYYLIQAFNGLCPDFMLYIVGEPSFTEGHSKYLKNIAGEGVKFLGFQDDEALRKLYLGAHIFVLPSEVEGLSISLLEAMKYGRCVLVSDIPESLEVIDNCGFSFKSQNIEDLRNKLQYLISNPEIVDKTGIAAKELVKRKYDWDRITDQIDRLYAGK